MNGPSLDAFEDKVEHGGLILINSSLIDRKVKRKDVQAVYVPATDIARELGLIAVANVVTLSLYALVTGVFDIEILRNMIPESIKKKNLVDVNLRAIDAGLEYYNEHLRDKNKNA